MNEDSVKMMADCEKKAKEMLSELAPIMRIKGDSAICSSCQINGSYDPMKYHTNGIFKNSKYFVFVIFPKKGKYHKEGGEVTVELRQKHHSLGMFCKSTTTESKAIASIAKWIIENRPIKNTKVSSDWIKSSRQNKGQ